MKKDTRSFLYSLLETPSPSGFEQQIQGVIKKRVARYADEVRVDIHGNLMASVNPDAKFKVMLAGHCDQIGFMVHHISEKGYVSFGSIGGHDPSVVPASEVTILTENGDVPGVVGFKPAHLVPPTQRGKPVELAKLWIDIGAKDKAEAQKIVSVGDPIVYRPSVTELGRHRIAAPGCDDRVGAFVVMEALRLFAEGQKKKKRPIGLYAVSTVQEEVGLRGARTACYEIDPICGIAVDVTHASDNPGAEANKIGTVNLGDGPTVAKGANINPVLEQLLRQTAKRKRLPFQPLASPGITGTDANPMQITRSGVASALLGIPNRYMHTKVEVVDTRDLEVCAKLIAETVLTMSSRMTFIPS